MNDVDTVATATPPYGAPFSGTWIVPDDLPSGDYALLVEVSKEFDGDTAHQHPSFINSEEATVFDRYGQEGNVGQPSVLFRLPFSLAAGGPTVVAATDIAGYGDFSGATGEIYQPDATIASEPGSGAGLWPITDGPAARAASTSA